MKFLSHLNPTFYDTGPSETCRSLAQNLDLKGGNIRSAVTDVLATRGQQRQAAKNSDVQHHRLIKLMPKVDTFSRDGGSLILIRSFWSSDECKS